MATFAPNSPTTISAKPILDHIKRELVLSQTPPLPLKTEFSLWTTTMINEMRFLTGFIKANDLETLAKEQCANENAGLQLSTVVNEDGGTVLKVRHEAPKMMWRLVYSEDEGSPPIEAIMNIQGIIWNKDLPPFYENKKFVPKRAKFLRQGVLITGLGSPTFSKALDCAFQIFGMFSRHVPENKLQEWKLGTYNDHPSLDLSNRIFTPRKDDPISPSIALGADIDPSGRLMSLAGNELFHGEDNQIQYMTKMTGKEGIIKYMAISPVAFQTGDIVEAKISFMVTAVRGGEFRMLIILRGLTLINPVHSQRAFANRMRPSTIPRIATLKRKMGYEEEEYAETRARLNKMRLASEEPQDRA